MKIINLDQGSPDWLGWREMGIGASDACHIVGTAPWNSPTTLRRIKTGKHRVAVNAAMLRGTKLEPTARRLFTDLVDLPFPPSCGQHDDLTWMRASFDGISPCGRSVLEIKCPSNPTAHNKALAGKVPDYYYPQTQHQLLVAGAQVCWYWSYFPQQKGMQKVALVRVRANREYQDWLTQKEIAFWASLNLGPLV